MLCPTHKQYDELCGEDAQEHAQRIDRGIADGWCFFGADAVGISQSWRVCIGTAYHTDERKVVELVFQSSDGTYY